MDLLVELEEKILFKLGQDFLQEEKRTLIIKQKRGMGKELEEKLKEGI